MRTCEITQTVTLTSMYLSLTGGPSAEFHEAVERGKKYLPEIIEIGERMLALKRPAELKIDVMENALGAFCSIDWCLTLSPMRSMRRFCNVAAHELIHHAQYESGRLRPARKRIEGLEDFGWTFEGKFFSAMNLSPKQTMELPWEQEAYSGMDLLGGVIYDELTRKHPDIQDEICQKRS